MNGLDLFQFYPTPPALAKLAWSKFKNRNFERVLEPNAGKGDLALAMHDPDDHYHRRWVLPDCCEIDVSHHEILRKHGLKVVGMDFLQMKSGAIYSHYIMNPPFSSGCRHVLKAWGMAWDAEIVAIINAETVRNPFSAERQHLVRLIEQFGEVEFIEDAFQSVETERKTKVEIALVYLKKTANISADIIGPILSELKVDINGDANFFREAKEVALPASVIENTVAAFSAAVRIMKEAVVMEARARYYARLLGDALAVRNGEGGQSDSADYSVDYVRKTTSERYDSLKDSAWANILRSADFTSKLSSAAQRRMESEFNSIKQLEFTISNIYGFLCGVIESQTDIQKQMMVDCFHLITRYHSENVVFYKGWKSNDNHRTCGLRVKNSRFILPRMLKTWGGNLDYDGMQILMDFDKVFAMLDGKAAPDVSLEWVFKNKDCSLRSGERISSSYFDVRWYPGVATIHFFPRDKKLIDRFNRIVGSYHNWLPPTGKPVSEAFWLQYEHAEKFDKEVREEVSKAPRSSNLWKALDGITSSHEENRQEAGDALNVVIDAVLQRHGINTDFLLETKKNPCLMLEAA